MKNLLGLLLFVAIIPNIANSQLTTIPNKKSQYYTKKEDSTYKYIWKIRMQHSKSAEEYTMTGFKIADPFNIKDNKANSKAYLASALHGWAKAKGDFKRVKAIAEFYSVERTTTIGARISCRLNVVSKNLRKDLVIFEMQGCEYHGTPKPLFKVEEGAYLNEGLKIGTYSDSSAYIAYGFPGTKDLQPNPVTVSPNAYSSIYKLVSSNAGQLQILQKLTSPDIDVEVISLMANDIQPGLSGSPVVNTKTQEVIAMGDGAVLNAHNGQVKSWAIVLDNLDISHPKDNDVSGLVKTYSTLVKQYTPGLFSTKENGILNVPVSKEKNLKATPQILISLSCKPNIKGLDYFQMSNVNGQISHSSVVIDASADFMPIKKLTNYLIGVYYNEVSLDYDIQTKDENGLPPNILAKNYRQTNKLLGLQNTIFISQGAFHHIYLGAGLGGKLNNSKIINNYRGFAGYRKYLFRQQLISIDGKILFLSTKENFLLPNPFGNANIKKSNLNQLYLCLGLNLSI